MAEETVLVRWKTEDGATGPAKDINTAVDKVGESVGKVGGGFSAMGSIASGVLQGIGQGLVGLATDLGSKALGAVTDFVGGSIEEASQWNSVFAQTQAVVESTGMAANLTAGEMADLAKDLSATSGMSIFSDDAILGAENVLATFTNIEGRNFGLATSSILDMSQALGMDLNSAAMQVGKALNDPVNGLSALSRSGIQFTEDQKAMIKAMVETGNTAGAQEIMLAELNRQFGGSAAAAVDTYAGQQVVLKEKFADVQQTLGEALMPILMQFGGFMADTLVPILATGVTALSAWLSSAETASILTAVFDGIKTAIAAVPGVIDGVSAGLATFAAFMQPVTDAATQWAAVVVPIIMQAASAITEYLASPTAQSYLAALSGFFLQLATTVRDILAAAFNVSAEAWKLLADGFTLAWPTIKVVLDAFYGLATIVLGYLSGMLTAVSQLVKGDFAGAWDTAKTAALDAFGKLWTFMEGLQTKFKTFFDTIKADVLQLGKDIAQGIADGIKDGAAWILGALTAAVTAAWNAATGWLSGQGGGGSGGEEGGTQTGTQGRSGLASNENGRTVVYNFTANYAGAQSESSLISDVQALMAMNGGAL